MSEILVRCSELSKSYHDGVSSVNVLSQVNFQIEVGERIAIVGPSGSGKSTLLHLLGGLDKPTSGQILIRGQDWQSLSEKKRCITRNQSLGFVYQFHHLLPEFSALENVALPLMMGRSTIKEALSKAEDMLTQVGLKHRMTHKPAQLSGGERQRVAIARALVHRPACVFADEPTGNLDQHTAQQVFNLMLELNQSRKTALVIVTHDKTLASKMDKILTLQDGKLKLS